MESERTYTFAKVSVPATEAHITHYSSIRLSGLKIDPQAFGSTFEREAQFTRQQWKERLETPGRSTFGVSPQSFDDSLSWVGTAGILNPTMLEAVGYTTPGDLVAGDTAAYMVVGMWVHPEHRRKGLGRRLIEMGFKVVQDDEIGKPKKILLKVHRTNEGAKLFYSNLGFVEGPVNNDSDGIWMSKKI